MQLKGQIQELITNEVRMFFFLTKKVAYVAGIYEWVQFDIDPNKNLDLRELT